MKYVRKTEIFNALSYDKNRSSVKELIELLSGARVESPFSHARPITQANVTYALNVAAKQGHYTAIKTIVPYLDDINAFYQRRPSAGTLALQGEWLGAFDALIAAGFDANKVDATGESVAERIARTGLTEFAKVLGKYNVDMNVPNKDGDTPFIVALKNAKTGVAVEYLAAGAEVSQQALELAKLYPFQPLINAIEKKLAEQEKPATRQFPVTLHPSNTTRRNTYGGGPGTQPHR